MKLATDHNEYEPYGKPLNQNRTCKKCKTKQRRNTLICEGLCPYCFAIEQQRQQALLKRKKSNEYLRTRSNYK